MDISMPSDFPLTDFRAFGLAAQKFFPKLLSDADLNDPQERLRHFQWAWQAGWCNGGISPIIPPCRNFADEQNTHSPRVKSGILRACKTRALQGQQPEWCAQTPNRSLVLHWDGHLRHHRQCLGVCTFLVNTAARHVPH